MKKIQKEMRKEARDMIHNLREEGNYNEADVYFAIFYLEQINDDLTKEEILSYVSKARVALSDDKERYLFRLKCEE